MAGRRHIVVSVRHVDILLVYHVSGCSLELVALRAARFLLELMVVLSNGNWARASMCRTVGASRYSTVVDRSGGRVLVLLVLPGIFLIGTYVADYSLRDRWILVGSYQVAVVWTCVESPDVGKPAGRCAKCTRLENPWLISIFAGKCQVIIDRRRIVRREGFLPIRILLVG